MEHRWGDRRRVILRVHLHAPGQSAATGWLTDISLSGAYVSTLAALALMSQIIIEVDECGGNTRLRPLQLPGRVVRRAPTGIGIEWEEFASGALGEMVRLAASSHWLRNDPTREAAPAPAWWMLTADGASNEERSCPEP